LKLPLAAGQLQLQLQLELLRLPDGAKIYRGEALQSPPPLLKEARAAGETPQVRPVAVGGIERRLFCATAVEQTDPHFAAWLGPHQVAVGVSTSAEKLAFGISAVLEDRPDFAV
jgi:hypothetical protein